MPSWKNMKPKEKMVVIVAGIAIIIALYAWWKSSQAKKPEKFYFFVDETTGEVIKVPEAAAEAAVDAGLTPISAEVTADLTGQPAAALDAGVVTVADVTLPDASVSGVISPVPLTDMTAQPSIVATPAEVAVLAADTANLVNVPPMIEIPPPPIVPVAPAEPVAPASNADIVPAVPLPIVPTATTEAPAPAPSPAEIAPVSAGQAGTAATATIAVPPIQPPIAPKNFMGDYCSWSGMIPLANAIDPNFMQGCVGNCNAAGIIQSGMCSCVCANSSPYVGML